MNPFDKALADIKAYHGLLMELTADERLPIDLRIEIIGKMKEISSHAC